MVSSINFCNHVVITFKQLWRLFIIFGFISGLGCFSLTRLSAQGFERPPVSVSKNDEKKSESGDEPLAISKDTSENDKTSSPSSEILQQLGLNISNNTAPRVTVKALRLFAEVAKEKYVSFYILSSIPTANSNTLSDIKKSFGNELQNIYGGLVNSYFSKSWASKGSTEHRGIEFEVKGGYKMYDTANPVDSSTMLVHVGHTGAEFRYLIPLKKNISDTNLAGDMQLKASFQGIMIGKNKAYTTYFGSVGDGPPKFFLSGTIEASIYVIDEFYLSGGYTFNNNSLVDSYGFLKLTFSRKK